MAILDFPTKTSPFSAPKPAAKESRPTSSSPPWKLLVVDDDLCVHDTTRLILDEFEFEGRPVSIISGYSGVDAKRLITTHPDAAVLLLDVIMESDSAGLEAIEYIRNNLKMTNVRILLRTGQAGQFSEEAVFEKYDINAFMEKTDITSRSLKSTLKSALRSYRMIERIDNSLKQESVLRQCANEASVAKSDFLASMSHELRSPMTSIIGFRDIIQEELDLLDIPDDKKQLIKKYLDYQEESSERLLRLINDILDLSKLEANKMDFKIKLDNLQHVIEYAVAELRPAIDKKRIRLHICEKTLNMNLPLDSARMVQAIINLVNNAIKFSPEDEEITITLTDATLGDAPALAISIQDRGPGIPEAELEKVFDKYAQSSLNKTGIKGTGLGLAIVKEIVQAHAGHVVAKNNASGTGCQFTVTLPR